MMSDLAERIAIITGSGQGIGRAIALELARRGARIVTNDVTGCCADETLALVREMGSDGLAVAAHPAHQGQRFVSTCPLYTSPSPRDRTRTRMPSSA